MHSSVPRAAGAAPAGHDTTSVNRTRHDFTGVESVWLFGYGSLIYKADFPYLERRPATIRGWTRRLWQGSHDHRGTPEHPGRVATLVAEPGATCAGMAYRVAPATFEYIDFREKNGYLRHAVALDFGGDEHAEGLVYIADAGNAAWLGAAGETDIARHVAASSGPSGRNSDYVLKLAEALRDLGANDSHVFAVEAELRKLSP
jgi:cation transport regulator ChaC